MDKKLIKNYIYNILYQMVKIILPFILVPYTYEHITPKVLGTYNFAGSIMQWFILFGILGINTYGNREIAKVRDDKDKLNKTFFEIFFMQISNMLIAMAAYYLYINLTVHDNKLIFLITGITMFASMLDVTWFFYGVEDFKKVSIRNVIVKILGVSLIMLICKNPEDIYKYIIINIASELIGQGIMFFELGKYIKIQKISLKEAYHNHFKATFALFVPTIAISIYTMLDQTMIGYLYSDEHVSYYLSSMNIVKMFLYFITSIGAVVLPRVTNSFYNDENWKNNTTQLLNNTMRIAMLLALPMCFGMMMISKNFISWYLPDTPIISDLIIFACPIIIFISMSNVTGIQYMVPTGMYDKYSKSVIAGATINLIINLLLIPKYGAYGAVVGSLIAEFTVTLVQYLMIRNETKFNLKNRSYLIYIIGTILMSLGVFALTKLLSVSMLNTFIEVFVGIAIYGLVLLICKEEILFNLLNKIRSRNWYERNKYNCTNL